MSRVVVQKYGGTSLATVDHLTRVAQRIVDLRKEDRKVVVVVSAMGGETDRLLELARKCGADASSRELDSLLSSGEQISSALLAIRLHHFGLPSVSLTADQIPIRTDAQHGAAQIVSISPQRIVEHLQKNEVVVVAGFQGMSDDGCITTLGRGGSDLTAVAIAAAVEADHCEIFTDVPGVLTADPRICSEARTIQEISYDEMLELAGQGANVLQVRAVQLAKRYMVPVLVRSTFEDSGGTWVKGEETTMEGIIVNGITCERKEAKISVRELPDPIHSATRLFDELAEAKILLDVIVQDCGSNGKTNLTFTVPREDFSRTMKLVEKITKRDGGSKVLSHEKIAKISAVGLGMRNHTGVAARVFRTLAKEQVEIMAVSTSEIKISCVIDDRYAELAVRVLHDEFGLAKEVN